MPTATDTPFLLEYGENSWKTAGVVPGGERRLLKTRTRLSRPGPEPTTRLSRIGLASRFPAATLRGTSLRRL